MRTIYITTMVIGTGLAASALVLVVQGWLVLAPYPLIVGGSLLLIGGVLGALGRQR